MKFAIVTFGCRVNQADSLGFEESCRAAGLESSPPKQADVVIVNTCSVTATADQGARQTIRRISRENPDARIVVTGCYATRRPAEVAALAPRISIVSNASKSELPELAGLVPPLLQIGGLGGDTAARFGDGDGPCGTRVEPGVAGRTAFTLRVQTGCAEPCSYCIIPATRGAPRSVPLDVVLAEIDRVVDAGFKEIVLTGVHLGSYGRDRAEALSLTALLYAIERRAHAGVLYRISSLEPMDCTPEIVELVASSRVFAPHFHLPLQHGADRLLAAMRRPYTASTYDRLVSRIRQLIPHASIGSDVIVGFPSESDSDFEQLAAYLVRSPLTHVHVFPYSDRPGTDASKRPGKVPGPVVRERAGRVREIANVLSTAFYASQTGAMRPALTLEDGSLVVTDNYLKLRIPPGRQRNEWVRVKIEMGNRGVVM